MPRLPDYTALGEAPIPRAPGGVAGYQPADQSGFARGVTAAGRQVEEAASILAESNARQDQMVAEAAVNQLLSKRLDLEAGDGGFKGVKGAGAVGPQFLQTYEQKFKDAQAEIEQSLTNEYQRSVFKQKAPVAGLQFRSALLAHQAGETDKFNESTENDTIELARRQVFDNPADPMALTGGLAKINQAIDWKGKRLGWGPAVIEDTKRTYQQKVLEDTAALLVERDPVQALAAMNKRIGVGQEAGNTGIAAIDGIGVPKLVELRHRAVSYVTQAENKLKAEGEKRLKEAESEAKDLQSFVLTGQMVSPIYEQQVLAKVKGTQFEIPARELIRASQLGAMHGSLTIPQQEANLRQIDATFAGAGSSPEQKKVLEQARQITETQKREYKENPWAAASRFNRQPDVPEQQFTTADEVPKIVANRLGLITGVEVAAGHPVSPLQPNEARVFAEKLKALPPEARAEVLAQTGSMLSGPRGTALAEQLDKHDKPLALALKMGLDRTTAGRAASTLVLRGAQALADKTVKKDDQALAGWRAEIANLVRGSLGNDQAETDVIDASYFVRAAQDVEGIGGPNFTRGVGSGAEDAVAMVIGRPMTRAGVKTILPRGLTERDFDAKLSAYTPQRLRELAPTGEVYVRGAPVKVDQIANHLSEYGLKRDGAGRYIPVVRNAPITLDAQGQQMLRLEVR